jgi:methionine-rich copper-binding protein CopC
VFYDEYYFTLMHLQLSFSCKKYNYLNPRLTSSELLTIHGIYKNLRQLIALIILLLLIAYQSKGQDHSVLSTNPANNALNIAPAQPFAIRFSQAVSAASAGAIKLFSTQRYGYHSTSFTGSNTATLIIQPTHPFVPGEVVSLTVPATVASTSNVPNATPLVYQFTTAVTAGNGRFQLQPTIASGGTSSVRLWPEQMATGDLDGDGDLDIVVPSYEAHTINSCLNDGVGNFAPPTPVAPAKYSGPIQATLADVDSDGDLDLLVVCQLTNSVTVYRNSGSGTFTPLTEVRVGPTPAMLQTADVDADGDLDFVVSNTAATTVSIRLNTGTGTFTATPDLLLDTNPAGIALGDIDLDGDLDLVVANGPTVSICLNDGAAHFAVQPKLAMGDPYEVVLADLNQDGQLDLLTGDSFGFLRVRLGSRGGVFGPMESVYAGSYHGGLVVADLDADGSLDVIRSNGSTSYIFLNKKNGFFTAARPYEVIGSYATSTVTGDLDGDGDIDILVANYNRGVSELLNQGALPTLRISGDTLVCHTGQAQLTATATAPVLSYRWSTGATTASVLVSKSGTYSVTATFSGGLTRTTQHRVEVFTPTLRIVGDSILCAGATVNLLADAPNAQRYEWSTGATTASLTVTQPGTYSLTAHYSSGCTAMRRIVVKAPTLRITGSTQLCAGTSSVLTAVAPTAASYHWSTGASGASLAVNRPGSYSVVATFFTGCTLTATVSVTQPTAAINGDSIVCAGNSLQLSAAQPTATAYRWNTGATTSTISVNQSGTYSVVVSYADGCQSSAQHRVRSLPAFAPFSLGADTTLCEGTALLLRPLASSSPAVTYRWSTGATTPTLLVQQAGTYSLQITTACESRTATRSIAYRPCLTIPNVITPNGDQLNDQFVIQGLQGDWSLQLYTRWGQQVYSTKTYHNEWGTNALAGIYYYVLGQANQPAVYKGWLEVIR